MKRTILLSVALALAFAVQAQEAAPPATHTVGFQAAWQYDHSRAFANGEYGESRPVPAFIWYPAAQTAGRPLTYGAYFDKISVPPERDSLLARFSEALKDYSLNSFKDYSIGWHFDEWDADAEQACAELLKTPFRALENAPPLPSGRFPVILYHPGLGGNLLENTTLCEQLAARGYIVISSSFHAQQSWQDFFYCGAIATSLEDLDFLLSAVAPAIPNADLTRIGLMGHSFGAQAGYACLARENNVIDAFVSLDNSFDYKTIAEIESPVYRNTSWGEVNEALTNGYSNCRATVLNISGTREDGSTPGYELVKRLFRSDIYLATFPFPILHESFLSEAALAYPLVSRQYSDSADVAALRRDADAYPALQEAVAAFFDHCLKGETLKAGPPGRNSLKVWHQPPLLLPSKDSILNLYAKHGIDTLQALYRQFQAISPRARMNVHPVLARMSDNRETENSIAFLEFLLDFHPEDWRLLRQAADSYRELGAEKEARKYYERALQFCDDRETRAGIIGQLRRE
ncbi:MAG: hypothetical protein J5I98_06400 [Phaeodactylibacter sp.]|nr:hypothetical protein [Phaeodactylibacter sp.]